MEAQKPVLQRMFLWFASKSEKPIKPVKAEPLLPIDYMNAVTKLADDRKDRRFLNDNDKQACLIAHLMVRDTRNEDEVLIYSNALAFPFYSRVLRATCFFDSKPIFRIILDDKQGLEVIKNLPEDVQGRIQCRIATTKDGAHMLLTPVAFRIEAKGAQDELFVVCNFYEPDKVQEIKIRFERIWANAVPVATA